MTVSPIGKNPRRSRITTAPLDSFVIDLSPGRQRVEGADQSRVQAIADNFNEDALGQFVASELPDGRLLLLDGMHRYLAAKLVGYDKPVDVKVFTGLTKAEEAELFLLYNTKKDPSAISKFHARVVMGDPVAGNIAHIIAEHGWKIGRQSDSGYLNAIEAAERVYRTASGSRPAGEYPGILDASLAVITAAWGHDREGVHHSILGGVAQIFGRFPSETDTDHLVRTLQRFTPVSLRAKAVALRDAAGGSTVGQLARVVAGQYNARKRVNLLPEWVWSR